jgi:hypothetical protein
MASAVHRAMASRRWVGEWGGGVVPIHGFGQFGGEVPGLEDHGPDEAVVEPQ